MRCNFWQSLNKLCTWGSEQYTDCFKTLPKVASHLAYQNSIIRRDFTALFLKYKHLKLKLRVFLAGQSVAMVTYSVTKIIPVCVHQ